MAPFLVVHQLRGLLEASEATCDTQAELARAEQEAEKVRGSFWGLDGRLTSPPAAVFLLYESVCLQWGDR